MNKIVKIVLAVVGVIAAIMWYQLPSRDVPVGEAVQSGPMSIMFTIVYLLLAVAVFASLLFTIANLFAHPKKLKKTAMVFGGFLLVVVIAYAMSSGTDIDIEEMANRGVATTESTVKKIGTGLNVFFILVFIAVASMAWGGLKKVLSK
ncbi:MAG: hypothetical protein ACR2MM_03835 [Flavobacteriaceae bacterium]